MSSALASQPSASPATLGRLIGALGRYEQRPALLALGADALRTIGYAELDAEVRRVALGL